jgi:hypothetical protein
MIGIADEELHRHAVENIEQADALLFGRVTRHDRPCSSAGVELEILAGQSDGDKSRSGPQVCTH